VWENKGPQLAQHLTAVGHVTVKRRMWWQAGQGSYVPGDEWLNGGAERISVGARELCCRVGCHPQGFRPAAEDLQRLAGLTVSPERLRRIVESEGRRVAAARASGVLVAAWQGEQCRVTPQGPSRVYVGVDGVMVPMVTTAEKARRRAGRTARSRRRAGRTVRRGRCRRRLGRGYHERYKEFKLTVFYDQDKRHRHAGATGAGPETVGRWLRREGRRFGLDRADEVLGLVDGAPWIRNQLSGWGGCDHIGLDFYHFTEHVGVAAQSCFGEGTAEAAGWRTRVRDLALQVDVDAVLDEIMQQRLRVRARGKQAALARLRNYVGERVTMLDYAACRAKGWDIGSGPTESLCKTMTARLKGSGMRWDPANAQAMLALTGLHDSREWDAYWRQNGAQWN
jgi:hypothetical protein